MGGLIIFISIVVGMLAVFFGGFYYLAKHSQEKDNELFQKLAAQTGFKFIQEGKIAFQDITKGMLDFGSTKIELARIVSGQHKIGKIVLFDVVGESFSRGTTWIPTAWSGCFSQINQNIQFEMIIYHKDADFGKLKKYKQIPSSWTEMKLSEDLKDYKLASVDLNLCNQLLENGLYEIFLRFIKRNKKGVFPTPFALQIMGNRIAIYADQHSLRTVEDYLTSIECVSKVFEILHTTKKI